MSSSLDVVGLRESPTSGQAVGSHSHRFDWVVVALSAWLLAGLYVDGWAHRHLSDLETFFTPWHGVLYSGFGAAAAYLGSSAYNRHVAGYSWRRALPPGYHLSLMGVLIFLAGGVGDMVWHTLFGVEVDLENLLSPTHLILAFGGVLIMSGSFRSIWLRSTVDPVAGWAALAPAILSLTFILSVFTFFTMFVHPFVAPRASRGKRSSATE